jgi:hypothetical protein
MRLRITALLLISAAVLAVVRPQGTTASSTPTFAGESITMAVSDSATLVVTGEFGDEEVSHFILDIAYDPALVDASPAGCDMTIDDTEGGGGTCDASVAGLITLEWGRDGFAEGSVQIAVLTFASLGTPGVSDVTISVSELLDSSLMELDPEMVTNGAITILSTTPTVTPVATPSPLIQGDLNCDGMLTGMDAFIEMRHVAVIPFPTPPDCPVLGDPDAPSFWGDYNCDGLYTTEDVLRLVRQVAGIPLPPILDCRQPGAEYE